MGAVRKYTVFVKNRFARFLYSDIFAPHSLAEDCALTVSLAVERARMCAHVARCCCEESAVEQIHRFVNLNVKIYLVFINKIMSRLHNFMINRRWSA